MQEKSITEIQLDMQSGKLTSGELTRQYLARIAQLDQSGPALNAVIEVNPDALQVAGELDAERRQGKMRGRLHGIPVMLKDNIDTHDKMQTTAGSLALEGNFAKQDAFLAAQLRARGAVLLAKTNLSEWANFRGDHSISGWSSRGGQTRNPYALDRSPCGSSSGSAVAVAANLCAAAIGTETDGSIVCPAQTNGVVGIKPTLGLVSRSGVIPIAHSQDTAGPLGRSVADAVLLLEAMTGVDGRDPATKASQGRSCLDYSQFLDSEGLKGARLGVARNYFGFDARVDRIMEASIAIMEKAGAEIVDPANIKTENRFEKSEMTVVFYEFKADLNSYLENLGPEAGVHSLQEVIDFNQRNREKVMPYFGQERMEAAQAKGPLTQKTYLKALERNQRLSRAEGIDAVLQEHTLDAIIAPTGGPAWLVDRVNGDHYGGGCSSVAAVAGYPHITVPAGYIFGLPVGISFFASAWQEPTLIRLAYAFELASQVRTPPQFLPSVEDEIKTIEGSVE
ncbi:MAG: amidase [Anaerolineales bacterium]|nr:amidase [Anaerolineales bacterium]